jgi:hypothetical protein
MGLRPALVNPRTLVRTWGTQTELVGVDNQDPFHPAAGRRQGRHREFS